MALTSEEIAVLEIRLGEAKAAYHQLMLGTSPKVYVDQNGERIEYNTANAFRLSSYIANLERMLGRGVVGPMNVWM